MPTSVGNLWVDVRFDTSSLGTDLRRSLSGVGASAGNEISASLSSRLQTIGTSLGNVGRQVSLGLSLPLAAFGRAATSAFVEFDTAMTQITTLSGVAAETTQGWTDDVMELGTTYGVSATEAAQGLYFITSAGIDAADAIGVLDIAAKSSALGLGSVKTVADVVTSAMNQYGKETISAAQAADILTVAVREGKGEADEMAGALARVIPLAGSMGVQFDEVSGIMSAMTLSGTSADEAATQINALLVTLQKMPQAAQRDLKALTGLDYQTLQTNLRTQGLTQTLRTIYNAFGDNEEAIGKVFGNIRALRGITNLFGEKEEQTLAVVEQTTHAFGAQEKAIKQLERSPAWQLKQAQAQFSNAMTSIGGMVTPVVATITGGLAAVLTQAQALPGPLQSVAVSLGAVAVAAGPLLYVGSSALRLIGNIGSLVEKLGQTRVATEVATRFRFMGDMINAAAQNGSRLAGAFQKIGPLLMKGAVAAGTAAIAWQIFTNKINENAAAFEAAGEKGIKNLETKSFDELGATIDSANAQIAEFNRQKDALNQHPWDLALHGRELVDLDQASKAIQSVAERAAKLRGQAISLAEAFGISREAAVKWLLGQQTAGTTFDDSKGAIDAYTTGVKNNSDATKQATTDTEAQKNSLAGIIATVKDTSDAFFAVINAQKSYAQAQKAIADAKAKVVDAEKAHIDAVKDVAAAQRKIVEADRKVIESGQRVAESRQAAADAQKRLNDLLAGPSPSEQLDVRSARLSLREAEEAARKPGQTPLERERSAIALERARLDLAEAQRAHDEAIADARKDVKTATEGVADAEKARQDAIVAAAESRDALQVARDKEHQSLLDITTAQQNVAQAQIDSLKPAMDLTTAQEDLNTRFRTGTIESDKFRNYLTQLKDLYPELTDELQHYIDKFNELQAQNTTPPKSVVDVLGGTIDQVEQAGMPAPPPPPPPPPRQFPPPPPGGYHILGGMPRAPEAMAPSPFVLPVDQGLTPYGPAGRPSGGDLNVSEINVYGADQPVQTAYEIRRQLRSKRDLVGRR